MEIETIASSKTSKAHIQEGGHTNQRPQRDSDGHISEEDLENEKEIGSIEYQEGVELMNQYLAMGEPRDQGLQLVFDDHISEEDYEEEEKIDSDEYQEGVELMNRHFAMRDLEESSDDDEVERQIIEEGLPALDQDAPHPLSDDDADLPQELNGRITWTENTFPWNNNWLMPFTSEFGPFGYNFSELQTPSDYFLLLFDQNVLGIIVEETNRYAEQFFNLKPEAKIKGYFKNWKPIDQEELKIFLGIILFMGFVKLPEMRLHWEHGIILPPSPVAKMMTRDRFTLIFHFLHLNNNQFDDKTDKLYKIRRFILGLLPKFKEYYRLEENIAIDEKMIKFTGRNHMKQYIKNKTVQWGFKVFVLAEASTGYVYNWSLYEGRNRSQTQEKNISTSIVNKLVTGLENKGHKLYTDNYYTSVNLALELAANQIGLTGTVRVNRKGLPESVIKRKNVNKGQCISAASGKLLFLRWKDKRDIYMLSTVHDANKGLHDKKPTMVRYYTRYMRGVDRGDQLTSYYNFDHRSIKWWKRIFVSLIETTLLNSFIIFRKVNDSKISLSDFRQQVIHGLWINSSLQLRAISTQPTLGRLIDRHTLATRRRKNCYICSTTQNRKTTKYFCIECDKNVHPICFKILHEKQEIKTRNKSRNSL